MRGNRIPVLLTLGAVAILAALSASSARAAVLFADTFDRPNSSDLNASTNGKSGLLGAIDWSGKTFDAIIDINNSQVRTNNNDSDGNDGGVAWVDYNFTGLTGFTVTVGLTQSSGGDGRFAGFSVGQSLADLTAQTKATPNGLPADVNVSYDNIGTTKGLVVYHAGVSQGYVPFTASPPDTLSAKFTFADMNAGSALNYEVFLDGNSITTGSTTWSGTDENYISLQSNSTNDTRFDNFAISADVPGYEEVSITTNTGTDGVSGHVDYDSPSNFGGTNWHVKNGGPTSGYTRKGYIRFDIPRLIGAVEDATLELQLALFDNPANMTLSVYGLTDESLDNWDPASTDYQNAPANDLSSGFAADLTKADLLGTFSVPSTAALGDTLTFSGAELVDFLNADTNGLVTFILGRSGGNLTNNFLPAGDTHATLAPPTLNLAVRVPEPSTLVLAAFGLLGLAWSGRRRRR